jgi:hypothetical protein
MESTLTERKGEDIVCSFEKVKGGCVNAPDKNVNCEVYWSYWTKRVKG